MTLKVSYASEILWNTFPYGELGFIVWIPLGWPNKTDGLVQNKNNETQWLFFFFFFLVKKRKKRCLDRLEISPGFLSLLSVMGVKLATGNKMWRRE
jgi:hypothetical protein